MSPKTSVQVVIFVLLLLALLATPFGAQAGGVCGGTWTVTQGETLDIIAATCGTTVAAITAANPGVSGSLKVGQVITVPGATGPSPSTPVPNTGATPAPSTTVNNYYTTNNYYNNNVPTRSTTYSGNYVVQYGDTFSGIANRYGISVGALWAANPYIWDINLVYVGQVIYIPGSSGNVNYPPPSAPTAEPVHLTAGTAPKGTPNGTVNLSNQADADVYVSLQATTADGSTVINEYPVSGRFSVKVPAGWYVYVAWVGGEKFVGQFKLGPGLEHTLTFHRNKVVVQ